jgi:hypothetical protein
MECEKCDGEGSVNIRVKEFSLLKNVGDTVIKIGNTHYKADLIQIIAISAQMLQEEYITYRFNEDSRKAGIFSFSDINIVLMPITETWGDLSHPCAEIFPLDKK